jgi:predicted nuclease of predicted toxin-antitoxin system
MAALYLDEDVPVELADLLRARGHSATTTRNESRLGRPDPDQLLFTAKNGFVLVTHNRRDFARLHEAWLLWARDW